MVRIHTDNLREWVHTLRAGEEVELSGTVYTARDAAHKRMMQAVHAGEKPPFPLRGSIIYYAGPTPTPPGQICGSFGPTTSGRMDVFAPEMYDLGLGCTIGKGGRSQEVVSAIARNRAAYLCALGGAGALAARCITSLEIIAYEDLGCESVKRLTFRDFPLYVALDSAGGSIFS